MKIEQQKNETNQETLKFREAGKLENGTVEGKEKLRLREYKREAMLAKTDLFSFTEMSLAGKDINRSERNVNIQTL